MRLRVLDSILYQLDRQLQAARHYENVKASRRNCLAASDSVFHTECRLHNFQGNSGAIEIGMRTHIRGELLVYAHGGAIAVGHDCYIGAGTRIWSSVEIRIGDRVLVSHNVDIHDNDAHPLDAAARHNHFKTIVRDGHPIGSAPFAEKAVHIEDDAWIGFNAAVLKGVRIGRGAIVAAHSVVTKDVAPGVVVAGNPAREVHRL